MLNPADLVQGGKLRGEAIDAAADAVAVIQALNAADAKAPAEPLAALAILAGNLRTPEAIPALTALLTRGDLAGKAAAWALGRLAGGPALLAAAGGGLDQRENAYYGLAVLAANAPSPDLTKPLVDCVHAEIARAKAKQTGLGEKACRVLAILGASETLDLIQQVIEHDPYTDRFELQRLRKAIADGRRDQESISELSAPWRAVFADQLYIAAAPPAPPAPAPAPPAGKAMAPAKAPAPVVAKPPSGPAPTPSAPDVAAGDEGEAGVGEVGDDGATAPTLPPIDWKDFLASPEAIALPAPVRTMAGQLGPLLEQLAARAVNAALADLAGQEFLALLLQVLPQALPPQHVQAALSPQAINGYQAIAKYLHRTGAATHGDELIEAVKLVRQQLTAQVRQAGILNGPDYSDPDEKKPTIP